MCLGFAVYDVQLLDISLTNNIRQQQKQQQKQHQMIRQQQK